MESVNESTNGITILPKSKWQNWSESGGLRRESSIIFNEKPKDLISGNIGPDMNSTYALLNIVYSNIYKMHKIQVVSISILIITILLLIVFFIYVSIKENEIIKKIDEIEKK